MKNEDFGELTLMARIAFAIMCFERYALSIYPNINFKPAAEKMWHIVDGSDYVDEASYKMYEMLPEKLYAADNYDDEPFNYMTREEYSTLIRIMNKNDRNLSVLIDAVFDVAMSYSYTEVEPYAPDAFPYLQTITDVLRSHHIDLPDLNLLSEYTAANPRSGRKGDKWMGDYIDGKALSIFL